MARYILSLCTPSSVRNYCEKHISIHLPSHLASSSLVIGSSLGGSNSTGSFGANGITISYSLPLPIRFVWFVIGPNRRHPRTGLQANAYMHRRLFANSWLLHACRSVFGVIEAAYTVSNANTAIRLLKNIITNILPCSRLFHLWTKIRLEHFPASLGIVSASNSRP